jgi:methyl-accepting chemotaxis protein
LTKIKKKKRNIKLKTLVGIGSFATVFVCVGVIGASSLVATYVVADEETFRTVLISTGASLAALLLIGLIASIIMGNALGKPVDILSKRLSLVKEGKLEAGGRIPSLISREYIELNESIDDTMTYLHDIIEDIDNILVGVAVGDLTRRCRMQYPGDYKNVAESLKLILDNLNVTVDTIEKSSSFISEGAVQISASAQILAKGSVETASSIQQLSAGMNSIEDKLADTVADTGSAKSITELSAELLSDGHEKMQELLVSMSAITSAAEDIKKINQAIDDIAFQTNILALNAAIEAARAGAAGKGFAVVAEEVRDLAGKSQEAATTTSQLIEETLQSISIGASSADEAASALVRVKEHASGVVDLMGNISDASILQAGAVSGVNEEMERLTSVATTGAETSTQFAETSKVFGVEAKKLSGIVSGFTLNRNRITDLETEIDAEIGTSNQ